MRRLSESDPLQDRPAVRSGSPARRDPQPCYTRGGGSNGRYGKHLGIAFQLTDDMLDYSGDDHETGKNLGDDLAEGKPTLPLIYAMRTGSSAQATIIRNAIEQGGEGGFQPVLDVIQQTGALDYTRQRAQTESDIASRMISRLPDSDYKECLLQLSTFAVARNY